MSRRAIGQRLLLREHFHEEAPVVNACEFVPHGHVTKTIEGEATICDTVFLGERDQWLYDATEFLCLGQSRLDRKCRFRMWSNRSI